MIHANEKDRIPNNQAIQGMRMYDKSISVVKATISSKAPPFPLSTVSGTAWYEVRLRCPDSLLLEIVSLAADVGLDGCYN